MQKRKKKRTNSFYLIKEIFLNQQSKAKQIILSIILHIIERLYCMDFQIYSTFGLYTSSQQMITQFQNKQKETETFHHQLMKFHLKVKVN